MIQRKRTSRLVDNDLAALPAPVTIAPDQLQAFVLAAAELIQVAGGIGATSTTGVVAPPEKLLREEI